MALVGWKVVERWFCAGAEVRRGGARRSGMEAALGWIGFQGVRPGVFKGGRAGIAAGRSGIRIPATSPVISGFVAEPGRKDRRGG